MLCGAPPFVSEGFGDIIIMHVMKEPEPPQLRNAAIPDAVSESILRALAKNPDDRFQSMIDFQTALRGIGLPRATPVHGVPSVGTTSILEAVDVAQESRLRRRPISAFDATMATPAPVSVRPPSFAPSHIPTLVDSSASPKQTTTFRTATGEVTDTVHTSTNKRRNIIAAVSIVGFAAAGLTVTLLVTRSTPHPAGTAGPAATSPAPDPDPIPAALPERVPEFVPPPPPVPPPTVEPTRPPPVVEEPKHHGGGPGRPRGAGPKPPIKPQTPAQPEVQEPAATAGGKKNTERW
jgi:serine/threonine-protein kinase